MSSLTFLVGLEPQEDGGLRAYIDHRSRGLYVVVDDPAVKAQLWREWGRVAHVFIPTPRADQLYQEPA